MSDPSQLSSGIADLNARTEDLDPGGTSTFDSIVVGGVAASDFSAQSVATALTAVGTNRATALELAAHANFITGAATGTGVVLPDLSGAPGADALVFNDGGENIKIYAPGSQTIDGTPGATGVTLTDGKRCIYIMTDGVAWVSAQLGVVSA